MKIKWFIAAFIFVGCSKTGLIISQNCEHPIIQRLGQRVPCTEFPSSLEVDEILTQHSDIIEKIEDMDGDDRNVNFAKYEVEECPGKSYVVIEHSSIRECHEIKKIINDDNFFGIPYGVLNI